MGYQEGGEEGGAYSGAILDGRASFTADPAGVWYGDPSDYELTLFGEHRQPLRIIRWEGPDRTVTEAALDDAYRAWHPGPDAAPASLAYYERYWEHHPRAPLVAAFGALMRDQVGRLWLEEYERPGSEGPRRWVVFSADGEQMLAQVSHPRSFTPLSIGADWILGASEDELGVEYLELHELSVTVH